MNLGTKLNQVCVYWSPSTLDKFAKRSFDAGRQFACRIDDVLQEMISASGEKYICKSIVYFDGNVLTPSRDGRIYRGPITDLSPAQEANPHLVDNVVIVRELKSCPSIRNAKTLIWVTTV